VRGGAEYRSLTAALSGFEDLGAVADLPTFDPHPQANALARAFDPGGRAQRIDYIFFRPARGTVELNCNKLETFLDKPLAPSMHRHLATAWASDHYGLSATFQYTGERRLG
jgi:hypothetical protein